MSLHHPVPQISCTCVFGTCKIRYTPFTPRCTPLIPIKFTVTLTKCALALAKFDLTLAKIAMCPESCEDCLRYDELCQKRPLI